jgi:hypothetical protein
MKQNFVTKQSLMVTVALIAAITIQLVTPITALADDGTTTPPPAEEVVAAPPVDEVSPVADTLSVGEVLGTLPVNVDLVVVGNDGQPEPLVSQAAAEAVVNSDPFWCPEGTDPVSGGCTSYANFTALLAGMHGVSTLTNGTVYVQAGVYGGSESQVTFNGNTLTNIGNLSLIGGWDLAAATPSLVDVTTFNVPVSIINWTHNVSVEDIVIDGATGSGLTVKTTGEASVNDVVAVNNTKDGVHIEAGNSVSVTNVQADYNGDDGIDISSDTNTGTISLNTIQANHNTDDGISVYSKLKSYINLTNITSDYNGGDGLDLETPGEEVACSYHEIFIPTGETKGVNNYEFIGPVLVVTRDCFGVIPQQLYMSYSEFNNNNENGMLVSTFGNFVIGMDLTVTPFFAPVTANNNGKSGAVFHMSTNIPDLPPFPWAYYQNLGKTLAGQPIDVYAFHAYDATEHWVGQFTVDNNQEYGYSLLTDSYMQCELAMFESSGNGLSPDFISNNSGGNSYSCWASAGGIPIVGGEVLDVSSDSSRGNDGSPLCEKYSIIILQLPNNDNVTVFCPISGQISVKSIGKKGLPGSAPDGITFVSSLAVNLLKNGAPASTITDGGHLKISFAIPSDLVGKTFVIMFWDEAVGKWVELPAFADNGGKAVVTDLGGGKQVLEGTKVLSDVGLVEASVNFPGTFMLVVK